MSNQKTTQLRRLDATEVALGDLLPIVDVSEVTSPTGETKHVTVSDFATYVVSGGFIELSVPYQGLQYANGLAFDEGVSPTNNNQRAYGNVPALGNQFSLFVRGFVASDRLSISSNRMIFGVGANTFPSEIGYELNSAGFIISGDDLFAFVQDGSGNYSYIPAMNFFASNSERAFFAGITKDLSGLVTFSVNGITIGSSYGPGGPGSVGTISNTKVVMGNGSGDNGSLVESNIKCTIYDAQIFNRALSTDEVRNMFYRGVDTTSTGLISSYSGNTLNAGPTQWLDSVSSNHILIPTTGAKATNPEKRFILSFPVSGVSQYLGDGSVRDVLPSKYVITSCIIESSGKPLVSIGSSNIASYPSASGTGSFFDNRVALVSASYGVNPVGLLALGVAHNDKSIYVNFSANAAPCTFSFDGYIRN